MHQYPTITPDGATAEGLAIRWQQGPIGTAFNGASVEVIIRAAIGRIEQLNADMPCEENRAALANLNAALASLDARTRDRYRRGVMGTAAP